MFEPYSAAMALGGIVAGTAVADVLGSVPTRANVPATSSSAKPMATADGTPVNTSQTPRQTLFLSALIVVAAMLVLLAGARFFRDARIG